MTGNALTIMRKAGLEPLEDKRGWTHRFEIRSGSSDRLYVVAKQVATGMWGCSCMGWRRHRHCKHLSAVRPVIAQIDLIDGIGPQITQPQAKPAPGSVSTVVRRQPKSEAAKAALKERTKRSFSDAAYRKYDASAGFGSPEEWARMAEGLFERVNARPGDERVTSGGKRRSGRRDGWLRTLGMESLPGNLAELKTAARKRMRETHPDVGGDAAEFRKVFDAYDSLAKEVFGQR